jgi:cyclophilin family peptidyl-prolyl cis-trans isomerase
VFGECYFVYFWEKNKSKMKKITALAGLACVLLLLSCGKDKTPPAPVASFTYSVNGYVASFKSTSTLSPTSLAWDFGDGQTATGDSASHTYSDGGSYVVSLTATNASGSNVSKQSVTIGKEKIIEIKTSFGTMYMWLYNETPLHKSNFLSLASSNFYDGTTFHRVIKDFMIQGGDPNSKDSDPTNDGYGGPGYTIHAEIKPTIKHDYRAVGAARDNNPQKKSNGSQFYIVENKTGAHHLDGNYTVFGYIMKGIEVAETIAIQPKDANDRPKTDIKMDVNVLEKTKKEIKDEYGYDVK